MAAGTHTALRDVEVPPRGLKAILGVPDSARGLIVFAHGSGSGRLSPRNNAVAEQLRKAGFATLLLDLLTPAEERDRRNVFDIALLAERLAEAAAWTRGMPELKALPIGYFGASTGAAAALTAAVKGPDVAAIVSRGGRPDMAAPVLARVIAPTLLIVGGDDTQVIAMNREAYEQLRCKKQIVIVPGATHLFEEPGTLEEVIRLAAEWFERFLASAA